MIWLGVRICGFTKDLCTQYLEGKIGLYGSKRPLWPENRWSVCSGIARQVKTGIGDHFCRITQIYEHKKINIPKSELSQQLFKNLSKFYEPMLKQIDPYKLGDKRRKLDIGGQYARRILVQFGALRDQIKIREFVDFLVDGCPDHSYVIDYDMMRLFLDNVVTSKEFHSEDYATKLTELSVLFMEEEQFSKFIGFVKSDFKEIEEEIQESLQNNKESSDVVTIDKEPINKISEN